MLKFLLYGSKMTFVTTKMVSCMLNRIPEPIFRTYVKDGLITDVEVTERVENESRRYMVTGKGKKDEFRLMLARGGDREFVSLDKLRNYLRTRLSVESFSVKPYEEKQLSLM